jgi:hypothetical protein
MAIKVNSPPDLLARPYSWLQSLLTGVDKGRYGCGLLFILVISLTSLSSFSASVFAHDPCPFVPHSIFDNYMPRPKEKCWDISADIARDQITSNSTTSLAINLGVWDHSKGESFKHVTYALNITRADNSGKAAEVFYDIIHSHYGPLLLQISSERSDSNNSISEMRDSSLENAVIANSTGAYSYSNSSLFPLANGIYRLGVAVIGMDNDTIDRDSFSNIRRDFTFFVTTNYERKVQDGSYVVTLRSYYDRIEDIRFNASKMKLAWTMPFDWKSGMPEGIFVRQEINIPKALFETPFPSGTFNATVNGVPLTGRNLSIDPYSTENDIVFNVLLNKNDLAAMSQEMESMNTENMTFQFMDTAVVPEFGSTLLIALIASSIAAIIVVPRLTGYRSKGS